MLKSPGGCLARRSRCNAHAARLVLRSLLRSSVFPSISSARSSGTTARSSPTTSSSRSTPACTLLLRSALALAARLKREHQRLVCVSNFPKGTDLAGYDQAHLDEVPFALNDRPRQTLGWMKPCEKLK